MLPFLPLTKFFVFFENELKMTRGRNLFLTEVLSHFLTFTQQFILLMSNMQPSRSLFIISLIFIKSFEHANSQGKRQRISNIEHCSLDEISLRKKIKRNTMMVHEWEQKRVSQMSYDAKGNVSRVNFTTHSMSLIQLPEMS